jgi:hypothetical protein
MSDKLFLQDRPTETFAETDWLLRALVRSINESKTPPDKQIHLTLLLDGFLVSGEPVSSRDYLKNAAGLPEVVERIDDRNGLWEEERANDAHVGYVHLKNARVFHPAGQPVAKSLPVWWRIKLSAVSAFTIGTVGCSP